MLKLKPTAADSTIRILLNLGSKRVKRLTSLLNTGLPSAKKRDGIRLMLR